MPTNREQAKRLQRETVAAMGLARDSEAQPLLHQRGREIRPTAH